MSTYLWYRDQKRLDLGGVSRYTIDFTTGDLALTEIYLRLKNLEKTPLRAIHLLNGPFILYSHVIPYNYNHKHRFRPEDSRLNAEVVFKNAIKPGQTFNVKLSLNHNSLKKTQSDGSKTYSWECDIVSQIVLSRKASILYDLMIGDDMLNMRKLNRSMITSLAKGDFATTHDEKELEGNSQVENLGSSRKPGLHVKVKLVDDLWTLDPNDPNLPIHLIVVTHGIFSNLTADMLYLKEQLASLDDNLVVTGYRGNAGRTEKGIHKLGVGVSFFVTDVIDQLEKKGLKIAKISFVAHSLGGPVQLYALKHVLLVKGQDYFSKKGILLQHFVCIASPMLGVLSEMSLWISWFLDLGTLGKTGRDLTLLKKLPLFRNENSNSKKNNFKPILETLPDEPIQSLLRLFKLRTVYANAYNDGIVPLRTSSLLYLDWGAMGDVSDLRDHPEHLRDHSLRESTSHVSTETNALGHDVSAVPYERKGVVLNNKAFKDYSESRTPFGDEDLGQASDTSSALPLDMLYRKRISKKAKWYSRISAKGTDSSLTDDTDGYLRCEDDESVEYNIPPKASAVESALNTLICPVPSRRFITSPQERTPVIFHDRFYHFSNIPRGSSSNVGTFKRLFRSKEWKLEKQVRIARKYHSDGLNWRKVLVYLPPDAHNNIVVRRRFANGYGWGVVDHIRDQIFEEPKLAPKI